MNADLHDRSVGDLTKQLSRDMSELVRREVELAKTEVAAKTRMLGTGAGLVAAAGVLAVAMLGSLVAAAIMALDTALADWLAALIVALILGVIAALLALTGLKSVRRATPPVPRETVDSVKEDVAWVKTQAKSGMK